MDLKLKRPKTKFEDKKNEIDKKPIPFVIILYIIMALAF